MPDERPNAMLTKTQRAFLKGEKEYTGDTAKQQRYQRRQAIKERVRNTMLDFKLLFETWEERGSGELFGDEPASGELGKGISALLALLYIETYQHGRFKNLLLRGVNQGEGRVHPTDDVMVKTTFSVEHVPRVDVGEAIKRFGHASGGRDLSDTELAQIAKLLRREKGIEAAQQAAEAYESRQQRIASQSDAIDESDVYDPTDEFEE